jgi:hypothetical protein
MPGLYDRKGELGALHFARDALTQVFRWKVVLNLPSDDTVSSITVKMEGVAYSRLEPPREDYERRDRRRPEIDTHRVYPRRPIALTNQKC